MDNWTIPTGMADEWRRFVAAHQDWSDEQIERTLNRFMDGYRLGRLPAPLVRARALLEAYADDQGWRDRRDRVADEAVRSTIMAASKNPGDTMTLDNALYVAWLLVCDLRDDWTPDHDTGVEARLQRKDASRSAARERQETRLARHQQIQSAAESYRQKYPGSSANRVACAVARELGLKPETIRKILRTP